jgi:hypothetical protein
MRIGFISSILAPWATVRKVKVDVEVVRPPNPYLFPILIAPVAFAENSRHSLRAWYATRPSLEDFANGCHGVSCVRRCIVSFLRYHPLFKAVRFALINVFREGTHERYHYLICGVKGDFTRNLVLNPPTHLWTRQLKVR